MKCYVKWSNVKTIKLFRNFHHGYLPGSWKLKIQPSTATSLKIWDTLFLYYQENCINTQTTLIKWYSILFHNVYQVYPSLFNTQSIVLREMSTCYYHAYDVISFGKNSHAWDQTRHAILCLGNELIPYLKYYGSFTCELSTLEYQGQLVSQYFHHFFYISFVCVLPSLYDGSGDVRNYVPSINSKSEGMKILLCFKGLS